MSIDLVPIAVTLGAASAAQPATPATSADLAPPPLKSIHKQRPASGTPAALPQSEDMVEVKFDSSQHVIYRVVDKDSGEVIQQIPPEELLRVMRNIGEFLANAQAKVKTTV